MHHLPTIDHVDVQGKTVLVRADLNVPIKEGKILDTSRVERVVPTVAELMRKGASVVLLSHFGRPEGKVVPSLTLRPIVQVLSQALKQEVFFANDCIGESARTTITSLKPGEVCLLENLRFEAGEEKNDSLFSEKLSRLGDIYINDGFSVSHRAHASVEGITHFLPSYAGRLMQEEVEALQQSLEHPQRPILACVAGSKISTKLELLKNLVSKVDYLVLGGGIANTFLLARGIPVGASLVEKEMLPLAQNIEEEARKKGCTLVLPIDVVVAMEHEDALFHQETGLNDIQTNQKIFDLGPSSCQLIKNLLKEVKTVVWNGPLGVFEQPPFDTGTTDIAMEVARLTREGKIFSIAGGGETVAALNSSGSGKDFSYLSTAGGAFLEWLEGKTLPGVAALFDASRITSKEENKIKEPA
ncbi:phosphoglycerate kinase [Caedimonas varicaedens]|uniref:Phosphoglycerate kinase n=1 Tax=Caedimonas varicaedens TaxID=1629334 RepID=A0A0K8MCN8_9PROT|nr:phosphoglycerate kinase [Caedimonas varicaedens]